LIKLNFHKKNSYKILFISIQSFVFANFFFLLINKFYFSDYNIFIVQAFLFFYNFSLLYFFKIYSFSLISFLKVGLISFFGRCFDISIFYLLILTADFNSELSFFLALIISNIFKIFYLLKYKNYKKNEVNLV
jgi:hypothetical protein